MTNKRGRVLDDTGNPVAQTYPDPNSPSGTREETLESGILPNQTGAPSYTDPATVTEYSWDNDFGGNSISIPPHSMTYAKINCNGLYTKTSIGVSS